MRPIVRLLRGLSPARLDVLASVLVIVASAVAASAVVAHFNPPCWRGPLGPGHVHVREGRPGDAAFTCIDTRHGGDVRGIYFDRLPEPMADEAARP